MESRRIYCAECWKSIRVKHFNTKYCEPCRQMLLKRPRGTLDESQKAWALSQVGKIPREKIAEQLGTSISNLKRSLRGHSLWFKNGKYVNNPSLVRSVCSYYAKHGMLKTKEQFPDISVKSIVDRPEYYGLKKHKRQIRWTGEQITEAAKMAGLISPKAQAKYFNRPNAFSGSIKSLWMKRFKIGGGSVNGMTHWMAKELVNKNARYLRPVGESRKGEPTEFRRLILWVDMEKNLKKNVPPFICNAIHTMADFQRWLWKSKNPKPLILKMISERET